MEKKTIKKRTAVRKEVIHLSGDTKLIHSNRITNGRYKGFTLIQAKVFISIMKQLQKQILKSRDGDLKLELPFPDLGYSKDPGNYVIQLPLMDISERSHYKDVIRNIEEMRSLAVEIPPPTGFKRSVYSVIVGYDEPYFKQGKKVVNVYVPTKVAQVLVAIDRNAADRPIEYHNYTYEVIMNSKIKYTWKLYLLISSWKNKGGFKITYAKLREMLGIEEGEYKKYADFKRRVLIPVQKELEKKADCWFNCQEKGFEIRDGKELVSLNFKVIVPLMEEDLQKLKEHLINFLKFNFRFSSNHIRAIQPIFEDFSMAKYESISERLKELQELIWGRNGGDKHIKDMAAYVTKCLLADFI